MTGHPTLSLYQLAAHQLGPIERVLDGGCGDGAGTELLSRTCSDVVALDCDGDAVARASQRAPRAKVWLGDLSVPAELGRVDAAVLVDVLGHVKTPESVLMSMRSILPLGRPLFIAEPTAHRGQFLRAPARRAFARPGLAHELSASGFDIRAWLAIDGSFLACVATPFSEPAFDWLCRARSAADRGDVHEARLLFEKVENEGIRPSIRLEGALGMAHVSLCERNADGAVAACFRARALAGDDLRPAALLGRVALAVGETGEARRLARLAEQLDSAAIESAYLSAVVAAALGEESVMACWLSASNLAPDSLEIAALLAEAAVAEGDAELAIFALERVQSYGDDMGAPLHLALASALLSAGKPADALLQARLAHKLAPGEQDTSELIAACELHTQGAWSVKQ